MSRKPPPPPLYRAPKTITVAIDDAKGVEALFRRLRGPRENVVANLERIIATCATASERCKTDANALADEARTFRQLFEAGEANDFAVHRAMMIGAAFERLRADEAFGKDVRAGRGRSKGGSRNKGEHSALIDWARKQVAGGATPRGLAVDAKLKRKTKLSERQARKVLQGEGIMPRQNRN